MITLYTLVSDLVWMGFIRASEIAVGKREEKERDTSLALVT